MTLDIPDEKVGGLLRTLDQVGNVPIMVLDGTGEVLLFNSGCEELTDFGTEEVVGSSVKQLLPEKEGEKATGTFFPDAQRHNISVSTPIKTKNGEVKNIDWNVFYTDKGDGEKGVAICLGNTYTFQEQLESQLAQEYSKAKETAEKYKTLFEYAYDAILFSRFETGQIFEVNPEAENLLGYKTEELLQKKLSNLFTSGDSPQLKEQLKDDRFFYRKEQPLTKKDGSRVVASMSSSLIEFHGKKTILSLFQDMTKRIELEKELRSRAERLKKSTEKLEEIIHIISHDLKEPLRSIGTYSDMIFTKYRDELTDTSFQRLEDIKEGATQLKKMLDEVSNLAQVTADVSSEPVNVPELIEKVKGELGMDLNGVEITVDSGFPEVEFDKFQLKVLLKNLIANGLKYNEPPKQVEVGYNLEPEESKLAVFVRDNGEGIAEEHQERVFRMFEQLKPDKYSTGTGAGLTICKRIVEGSGEKIWLDSDPGVGTAVGFTVPIHEREGEAGDFIGRLSSSLELLTDSQKSRSGVIDEESGLYDRTYFNKVLGDRLKGYCEDGNEIRFLVIGFPGYEEFKDKYDADRLAQLRTQLSAQLKNSIRQTDLILRFSEKLFLVILPKISTEIEQVKSRIDAQISEWNDNSELLDRPVELSYGSSSLTPSGLCDPAKALKKAEEDIDDSMGERDS